MKDFLFRKFSWQIIVDVHPSKFNFNSTHNNMIFSIKTFVYLDNSKSKSTLIALGEEIPKEHITPDIHRIEIFDVETPFPPKTTLTREDLYQIPFYFGLLRCYENTVVSRLRPIVFILGASHFNHLFENPRDVFEKAAKRGGAGMIIFDKIKL